MALIKICKNEYDNLYSATNTQGAQAGRAEPIINIIVIINIITITIIILILLLL